MHESPLPPVEPADEAARRRVVYLEDALILLGIAVLWVFILAPRGPVIWLVLAADLALMVWLLLRRKRRVDELFERLRRQQQEGPSVAALYPGLPGFAPPPQERPEVPVGRASDD